VTDRDHFSFSTGAARVAIRTVLDRVQNDPDVRHYLGPGSATFDLLCLAECELTGLSLDAVRERRSALPPERRREAEVKVLRKMRERLLWYLPEADVDDLASADDVRAYEILASIAGVRR